MTDEEVVTMQNVLQNISSAGDKAKLCSTLLANCHQVVAYT